MVQQSRKNRKKVAEQMKYFCDRSDMKHKIQSAASDYAKTVTKEITEEDTRKLAAITLKASVKLCFQIKKLFDK